MKFKEENTMEGVSGSKPVPLPRRSNQNVINPKEPDSMIENKSISPVPVPARAYTDGNSDCKNNNNIASNTTVFSAANKPVPLPRKLFQRLTNSTSAEKRKSREFGASCNLPAQESGSGSQSSSLENEVVPDEVKRGTINLFKRSMDNPFDNDFEKSIKEAELLNAISFTSPLDDLDEASRSRFSTISSNSTDTSNSSSSASDDFENYPELSNASVLVPPVPVKPKRNPIMVIPPTSGRFHEKNFVATDAEESSHSKPKQNIKRALEKMVSCPPAPITVLQTTTISSSSTTETSTIVNESLYEPISSYSSSDSGSGSVSNFGLDPFMPMNPSAQNNAVTKRITVPNIDKNHCTSSTNGPNTFDATAYDLSDYDFDRCNSTSQLSFKFHSRNHQTFVSTSDISPSHSKPSSVISSDEDAGVGNRSSIVLRRNPSSRSTSTTESIHSITKKIYHEYDDVAIEDGAVVFTDRCIPNSDLNSLEVKPNKTSCSSLTSRNSVVQEFDPLFEPEKKSPPLDLNEDPLHRYEYIDVDVEDGLNTSSSTLGSKNIEFNASSKKVDPGLGYINPEYFPMLKKNEDEAAFVEESKILNHGQSLSSRKASDSSSDLDEEYEAVIPHENGPSQSPQVPPKPTSSSPIHKLNRSSSSLSDDAIDSSLNSSGSSSSANVSINVINTVNSNPTFSKSHTSDLVNQSNFFRRLSHKIRLNVIKEEKDNKNKDGDCSSQSGGPTCKTCFEEHPENSRCKFCPVPRQSVVFSSNLFKPTGLSKKDFSKKWAVLSKGKLTFYNEKSEIGQEILLDKVAVITKKNDHRVNPNLPDLKCFELGFANAKTSNMVLAGTTEGERCAWMQKYIEAYTAALPPAVISSYDRGGWCFIKESVTSDWHPSWLILKERTLFYSINNSDEHLEMDLRKARSVALNHKDGEHKCPYVDNHDVLTIDMICKILYVQTESVKITAVWEKLIHSASLFNGTQFHEMQLTMDNIPVTVDKCIDFLYAHGTLAEGIYRQSGSNTRITQLLADFQKDSWSVQISHKEFSAHDVAGTLKRFFRTLPEPLVTVQLYDEWIKASGIMDRKAKLDEYTRLLESLPDINYNIMKKLICHLYAVHELHEKNLMPLINLAPIWGPTLMNVDTSKLAQSYEIACAECEVVKDLIENYYTLFRVDPQEIAKEKKMQDALENFHLGSSKRKCSGDMKMWIYIWEKDETSAINITLTPLSTAHSILQQLCAKAQLRNLENLSLHEVICQKALERPLHPSEKVIETILRWSIWDVDERKNNYLILKKNTLYPALVQHAKEPKPVSGELKYADSKSKSFRKYVFQFSQAMLKYSKDIKSSSELGSWKIEDIVWYMGCEPKRTPPTRWTFTFVKRTYPFKRSKEEPFFGNVVSCSSEEELHVWIGAMVVGEHPEGLYPSVIV